MCCGYNPNLSLINKMTYDIGELFDSYISNYDNFFIVGDLNYEITENPVHEFCNSYNFHGLCYKSTCFKNPEKPSCIKYFLTNSSIYFNVNLENQIHAVNQSNNYNNNKKNNNDGNDNNNKNMHREFRAF